MTPSTFRRSPAATGLIVAGIVAVAVAVLFAIFNQSSNPATSSLPGIGGVRGSGPYAYQIGNPGPGQQAPPITLPTTSGSTWSLESQRGKNVLVYFQEGVGCQPCLDQIKAIEADPAFLENLGVDELVSITGSPSAQIAQKAFDMGLKTTVLPDPGLALSRSYRANEYGMMGDAADGHTFILVGPDGTIRWRADYGGPPNYTTFVPLDQLRADLQAGATKQ
ncbi:MAG: redoxin domain-containing protein [Actinobacteria bacterium]|nr:redoxin domain-containing protein [Actinomycetota bacterium]